MINFINKLASAIATQEGFFVSGSLPNRTNNPGDLRAAPWLVKPKIEKGYWHPASQEEGLAGLYHNILLNIARGQNLRQLIYRWAPPEDKNDTEKYIKAVMKMCEISSDTEPLWNYLDQLRNLGI